jgi:hypothetical protein
LEFVDAFSRPEQLVLVDPVMRDDGKPCGLMAALASLTYQLVDW